MDFLTNCKTIIENHFTNLKIAKCSLDKPSATKWSVSGGVWLGYKPQNWRMQVGVRIPRTKNMIIPWIWGVGKTETEDKMIRQFGDSLMRSSDVDLPAGTVALARVPVLPSNLDDFDIDADELLKKVEQAFVSVTKDKFENVYNYVKGL